MNLTESSMKHPYAVTAIVLMVVALGLFAFFRTPTDLFPDTVPPQVVVITVEPGAAASDVADKITQVIEKELNSIGGLKKVTSTSRDEVSSINAEFYYDKPIGEAVVDVQNAIGRIRASLPKDIQEPRIYRITDATRPLLTVAMSPKKGSTKTFPELRLLAENEIMDAILRIPGVADVDVFGGYQPEVSVRVKRESLAAHHLDVAQVIAALAKQNVSAPAGTIYTKHNELLIRTVGEFKDLESIRDLPIARAGDGFVRVRDVAEVSLAHREQRSFYHGNGKRAIALNVLRPKGGPTVAAIKHFKAFLPELRQRYPDIDFEITDDQQPIIDVNVKGMRGSLVDAIILTVLIIFIFLANIRAAAVVSVSIPLAFLTSLVVLWFSPYTLNMVTLSGLIIAVGIVLDASIVVLENITRHYDAMDKPDPLRAAREGTNEVALAVMGGTLTTVIVLIPVMFTGGYTQQTMRPLNMMIATTILASQFVAVTVVPLLASRLLGKKSHHRNALERFVFHTDKGVGLLSKFYIGILRRALRWRIVTVLLAVLFLVGTMKIVKPLVGGELMPPMDTGVAIIEFDCPSDTAPKEVEKTLGQVEKIVYQQPGVEMVSATVGSEPGQISFGGGGATTQSAKLTIHLVNRKERKETIWQIEEKWRKQLRKIPGIRSFRVSEYGATPLSTTKAPLDVVISGPDPHVVNRLADKCLHALKGVPDLTDVRRSWYFDKPEEQVVVDPMLAEFYGTSPDEATREVKAAVKGIPATAMRLTGYLDIPIRVQYATAAISAPSDLGQVYVPTRFGPTPLRAMASIHQKTDQPFITRERLENTIDITGQNRIYTIAQVAGMVKKRLSKIETPAGYSIDVGGTAADMKAGKQEMGKALLIGIILLYFLLLAMFKSFGHPITIMSAIPLAVAGGMWGLLLFDKPMCKPATMGMILLAGTIVNNSILLLDFILEARKRGVPKNEAILESVKLRIRPILMTTCATSIGLIPLIFEMAVGLERMSPLGIVAASGLIIGTFLTMVVVPVVYSGMDGFSEATRRAIRRLAGAAPTAPVVPNPDTNNPRSS